jgi:outer membrane protein assembly factor BamB
MGTTAAGKKHVAACEGVPKILKGGFYLFDGADGNNLWDNPPDHNFPTMQMDYTIAMAADGSAAAGGGNDGNVYYFDV